MRAKTGAPRPDRVLIDGELNARRVVWQQPRLGCWAGTATTLVLGLPLMMGLSTRQLDHRRLASYSTNYRKSYQLAGIQ